MEYNMYGKMVKVLITPEEFKNQMANRAYMANVTVIDDKRPRAPKWFTYWVETEFRPLKADVSRLKTNVSRLEATIQKLEDRVTILENK